MHRPSSAKLWQMPTPPTVLPTMPALPRRTVPLDEHDTSYLADSASTFSLWSTCSFIRLPFVLFPAKVREKNVCSPTKPFSETEKCQCSPTKAFFETEKCQCSPTKAFSETEKRPCSPTKAFFETETCLCSPTKAFSEAETCPRSPTKGGSPARKAGCTRGRGELVPKNISKKTAKVFAVSNKAVPLHAVSPTRLADIAQLVEQRIRNA